MALTPSLSGVSPTSYPADNSNHTLQVFGSNFQSGDTLTFTPPEGGAIASSAAKLTFVSSTEIDYQFNDGNDTGSWSVRVNSPDGSLHSSFSLFTVGAAALTPSLSSVSPTSVPADTSNHTLQIFGSNFQAGDTLSFTPPEGGSIASSAAKLTFVSSSEIDYQFNDASDAGSWSVRVNSPDGARHSSFGSFTVASAALTPSLSSISPTSFASDSNNHLLQIFGSNFQTGDSLTFSPPEGGSIVSSPARLTVVSSTEIDYQLNDGNDAGSWSLRVNSPDGSLHSSFTAFTVGAAALTPSLSSVSPTSVPADASNHTLQIFGSNFQAGDTLSFTPPEGGSIASSAAKLTVVSSTEIDYQFNDSSDAGSWSVRVNSPDGVRHSSANAFSVTAAGTPPSSGGSISGFDASAYPGDATMAWLKQNTSLSWVGYYLYPAPSRNAQAIDPADNTWMGHYGALASQGWTVAPLFVGEQDASDPAGNSKNPSAAKGALDAHSTLSLLLSEGFHPGTIVYLDVETSTVGTAEQAYVSNWCSTIASGGFQPGVYCIGGAASTIQAAAPSAALWVTGPNIISAPTNASVFPTSAISLSGHPTAAAWQYEFTYTIHTPQGGIVADLDIAVAAPPTQSSQPVPASISQPFAGVLREVNVVGADLQFAQDLASKLVTGAINTAQAITQIVSKAIDTTSVATLIYEFFTGRVPSAAGLDFLISPDGPNPNNLNASYYQSFNIENRYINFAVNLGKFGEGQAAFQSAYGSMSLFDAAKQAYGTIFGVTPTDAKVHQLIDSRTDYFTYYGQDGSNGLGTKAAMVGWLMAEAAKADVGDYAQSNEAFLKDVASNLASFGVDLIGHYDQAAYHYLGG